VAESGLIHLLEALSEPLEFHTGVFFTYGADLAFFEEAVLHPLWQNGCRSNLVFMDARRYADTIEDLGGSVTWVGRRYILIPVDLGTLRSFHPKLVLLLGRERGRLMVGSGNLTFTGFGHNHELFTCLDWTPDSPSLQRLFTQVWNLIKTILQRWGHSDEARIMLGKAENVSSWLLSSTKPSTEVQLFHTLEEPLIDQCGRALRGETITGITVVSPFIDANALVLKEFSTRFHPPELRLIFQDQRTVGNIQALERLRLAGVPLQLHRFLDEERYLHAKAYIFETADASYILTGSANCTRAAWLSTCTDGNVEIMLLRRAESREHFTSLLEGRIAPDPITRFDEVKFRESRLPVRESDPAIVHLLDVSVTSHQLSVTFRLSSLPEGVTGLQLRLSTTTPRFIPLGHHDGDLQSLQVSIPSDLQESIKRPLSASVWGTDAEGHPIPLNCNEVWITNVDVLRQEIRHALPVDRRAGDYLASMVLSDEDEWHDLYEALVRLIELDVAGLKQRGGAYTTSLPDQHIQVQSDSRKREREIQVIIAADQDLEQQREISAALYRESPLYAWLEYMRKRLPGAAPGPRAHREELDSPLDHPDRREQRSRRRWTPPEHVGRRFVNLVRKYIRSLANIEYMQTISIYHLLTYYSVFQRMTWLLFQHGVIDVERFVRLVTDINSGFFGAPAEEPPVLCPRLRRHIQRVWCDDWQMAEVPFHALASVILSKGLMPKLPEGGVEGDKVGIRVHEQNLRVLCGLASVVGISWIGNDTERLALEISEVYEQDPDVLVHQLDECIKHDLPGMSKMLDKWILRTTIALAEADGHQWRQFLNRARADYGVARCEVLDLLQDMEAQVALCSDLISWLRQAGDSEAERKWSEILVRLLQDQGKDHKAAQALFRQGRALFIDREYEQAANILRQAYLLAERLGDDELVRWCNQYLQHTEFFLQ